MRHTENQSSGFDIWSSEIPDRQAASLEPYEHLFLFWPVYKNFALRCYYDVIDPLNQVIHTLESLIQLSKQSRR